MQKCVVIHNSQVATPMPMQQQTGGAAARHCVESVVGRRSEEGTHDAHLLMLPLAKVRFWPRQANAPMLSWHFGNDRQDVDHRFVLAGLHAPSQQPGGASEACERWAFLLLHLARHGHGTYVCASCA